MSVSRTPIIKNGDSGYLAAKAAALQQQAANIGKPITSTSTAAQKAVSKSAVKTVAREVDLVTKSILDKTMSTIPGVLLGDQKAMETGGVVGRKMITETLPEPEKTGLTKLLTWQNLLIIAAGVFILYKLFKRK